MRHSQGLIRRASTVVFCLVFLQIFVIEINYAWPLREWTNFYNGPIDGWDISTAIASDTAGNIYVTGMIEVGYYTGNDYATIKYAPDGSELWSVIYDNGIDDRAMAIAVDISGNVYVTGRSEAIIDADTTYDYATIKYDTSGNELWVARYDRMGEYGSYDEVASDIALDDQGNVYVTGTSGHYLDEIYVTIKYDNNGGELWSSLFDGPLGDGDPQEPTIAVDAAGNTYITGMRGGGSFDERDYATIKYNENGEELWVAYYDGPENGGDFATEIALDISGNVYVTGSSDGSGGDHGDFCTIKYDKDNGNELWVARYDGSQVELATSLAVDNVGNVFVTGQSRSAYGDFDYATIKYDPSGGQLWAARYSGPPDGDDRATDIAIDDLGNVSVTGNSGTDVATVKYTDNGTRLWVARYPASYYSQYFGPHVAMSADGNVIVAFTYDEFLESSNYATVKYVGSLRVWGEAVPKVFR